MFRLLGKKAELYRYTVTYTENEEVVIEYCISEEHKNEIEQGLTDKEITFETKTIDQTSNEWFNGLEFDSYDKAKEALELGEEGYRQFKYNNDSELQLTAMILDVDYRLGIAEMGVQL